MPAEEIVRPGPRHREYRQTRVSKASGPRQKGSTVFKTRSSQKKQESCSHQHTRDNTSNGLRRFVCADCGYVSFESVGDTVTNSAVPTRRR